MKKEDKVWVTIWDGRGGSIVKECLYTNMTVKEALICGINQFRGNFNTWEYPKDMDGIYKSKMVKGRLLYDLSSDVSVYAQRA